VVDAVAFQLLLEVFVAVAVAGSFVALGRVVVVRGIVVVVVGRWVVVVVVAIVVVVVVVVVEVDVEVEVVDDPPPPPPSSPGSSSSELRDAATLSATSVILVLVPEVRYDSPEMVGIASTAMRRAYSTSVAARSRCGRRAFPPGSETRYGAIPAAWRIRASVPMVRPDRVPGSFDPVPPARHRPRSRTVPEVTTTAADIADPGSGSTHWGEIDGVSIDFPMVVEEMRSATLTFTVPIDAARRVLPGDAFAVAEVAPGSAMLILALCDYVRNPWGDYDEVNLGLLVHPVGRPDAVGAFQWRMPVDQEFTCTAGNRVLGLPKTVEDLGFSYSGDPGAGTVTVRLVTSDEPDGSVSLLVELPRPANAGVAGSATRDPAITYSYLDGRPMELPLEMELPSSFVDPADVRITLGEGALASELRSLGLPGTADLVMWGEGLSAVFQSPRPLT